MKLRSGKTTSSTPGLKHTQLVGVRNKRGKKSKKGRKIRLNDACLMEAMAYLQRDDLDSLPLVDRQFRRALSHPAYQVYGPRRLLSKYWSHCASYGTLEVRKVDAERWLRFFNQLSKISEDATQITYTVAPAKMAEIVQHHPWLRAKTTRLTPFLHNMAKIEGNIEAWSQLRQLWSGQTLHVVFHAGLNSIVDLSPIGGECRKMIIGALLATINISLANWVNSKRCGACQYLELAGAASIPPSDVASYLIAVNASEGQRFLKLSFPTQPYPLGDLMEAIKERFLATPNPRPFELQGRYCIADHILDAQDYSLKHPTANGDCTVRIRWENEEEPSRGFSVEVKYP